jgi:hypothetical protein
MSERSTRKTELTMHKDHHFDHAHEHEHYDPATDTKMGFPVVWKRKAFLRYFFGEAKKIAEKSGDAMGVYWAEWQLERNLAHVDKYGASC